MPTPPQDINLLESTGIHYSDSKLEFAQICTLKVIETLKEKLYVGITESQAHEVLKQILKSQGDIKSWHPPQIRFGENTIHCFGEIPKSVRSLQETDILFLDLGLVFDNHEGDVGRSFFIGNGPEINEFKKCATDVKEIWSEVRSKWQEQKSTGAELYKFANDCAIQRGWVLSLKKANGHRVADFLHTAGKRHSIEMLEFSPSADRWILEIQIRHPEKNYGAFYEDLLN